MFEDKLLKIEEGSFVGHALSNLNDGMPVTFEDMDDK